MLRSRLLLTAVITVGVVAFMAVLHQVSSAQAEFSALTTTYRVEYVFSVQGPRGEIVLGVPLPPSSNSVRWTRLDVESVNVFGADNYTLNSMSGGLQNILYVSVSPPATVHVSFNVIVATGNYLDEEVRFTSYRTLPPEYRDYVKPTFWWNYTIDNIAGISKDLAGRLKDDMKIAEVLELIRNMTVSKLHYTPMDLRSPVWKAVEAGTGDCSEFSDLYVSLARSVGIPALRSVGYIAERWDSSRGEYVLMGHAWPIVYVPGAGWAPVEATTTISKGLAVGVNPLDYICLYIDNGNETPDSWDPIRGDVLLEPNERWFVGFEETLEYNNYTISSSIKVYHPERLEVRTVSRVPLPMLSALIAFGALYTTVTAKLYVLGGSRED